MSHSLGGLRIRLERKQEVSSLAQAVSLIGGVLAALGISAAFIDAANVSVIDALASIFRGAFGGWESFLETLVQSTPIIFTGLAIVIAFRGRVWNIGAEGQFFAGAVASTYVGLHFGNLPAPVLIPLVLVSAMVGGALWGFIPGILRAMFNTNEIIVTVMLNYVMMYFVSFLLCGPLQEPGQFFMQTARVADGARLPVLVAGSRLHFGFVLAVLLSLAIYVFLFKTPLGFDIRALGESHTAARYKGVNPRATVLIVMILSGAIAGLAGGSEVMGLHHRLRIDISVNYGYTGIIIALLGRLNPVGVIIAGIFFGVLVNGSTSMMVYTGVPVALVYCVQGLVLICVLCAEVAVRYRIRRERKLD